MSDQTPQENTDGPSAPSPERLKQLASYWRANSFLIFAMLIIWALVSIVGSIFGIEFLNQYRVGQLPAGFWLAQQGAIYVFVVLIFVYALAMDRLDKKYDVEE